MGKNNNYLEYINGNASGGSKVEFVEACEKQYVNKLKMTAEKINMARGNEIVLLAGPSSAGKTTTAQLISRQLMEHGKEVFTISLDDYYKDASQAIVDENGTPDFETVDALDLELLTSNLSQLVKDGKTEKPIFDFLTGKRSTKTQKIEISKGDVVVVEGLHALNPTITKHLERDSFLRIYVNVSSRIYNNDDKIVLNKRNIRFVRRLVRDFKFRNSTVENTYLLWDNVTQGEDKYLFPYKDTADIKINSLFLYEPCVFKDEAVALLREVKGDSKYYGKAQALIFALNRFCDIERDIVPTDSLLREFMGY